MTDRQDPRRRPARWAGDCTSMSSRVRLAPRRAGDITLGRHRQPCQEWLAVGSSVKRRRAAGAAPAQARPGAVVTVRVHVRGWRAFGDMMDAPVRQRISSPTTRRKPERSSKRRHSPLRNDSESYVVTRRRCAWPEFLGAAGALVLRFHLILARKLLDKSVALIKLLRVRASGLRCRPRRLCAAPRRLGAGTALRLRLCAMMLVQPILDP